MRMMMMTQRSFIYACKNSVTFSSCKDYSYCNKRAIIETIMWTMPSGQICRSDIMSRWFGSGGRSRWLKDTLLRLPSYNHNNKVNCYKSTKSFCSVTSNDNQLEPAEGNKDLKVKSAQTTGKKSVSSSSSAKTSKQAKFIKKLHKENKNLFGELLETKQEKVKRIRKELKEKKTGKDTDGDSKKTKGSLQGKVSVEEDTNEPIQKNNWKWRSRSLLHPKSLPRVESVKLERAGTSINKNRKVDVGRDNTSASPVLRSHKGAEIQWALRNAPTKMKLIELSQSSNDVAEYEKGQPSTRAALQDDDDDAGEFGRVSIATSKSSMSSNNSGPHDESMPTVEQLINSFYETEDRQLHPKSETKGYKLGRDDASKSSRVRDSQSSKNISELLGTNYNEGFSNIESVSDLHVNDGNKNSKKDPANIRPVKSKQQAPLQTQQRKNNVPTTESEASPFTLPFYNPERNYYAAGDELEVDVTPGSMNLSRNGGGGDGNQDNMNAESIITSFPYPVMGKSGPPPAYVANGFVDSDKGDDNKLFANSHQQPLALTSSKVPSVSKILNATMSEEQARVLKRWEQKMIAEMGEQGFRQYKESILTNGKILHSNIETYLRGKPIEDISVAEPNQGHWNSLSGILTSVDHVHVLESHVIHPQLQYCGIVDCVAEFRNRLVLIDWKTSQKPKPLVSMTYDTPLQIAAYIGAINYDPKYSLKIDDGMIVVAYEDGSSCQTFLLNSTDIGKYWKLWLQRLRRFRMLNPPI
ncbi:unnamed protein product [Orchesella dallaii]|uniref:Mitochondrial genome maintenance exonuclease 1 n=1 Tax=Orchesella dallaii TaxID=48710 RepID=A0ABP1QG27_9HEXA